ncbi:MAG: transcription-repair coupling factor [Gemmataceae bacterium]
MPRVTDAFPATLQELPAWLLRAEGFSSVLDSLKRGQAATVDGAWNSSAALTAATLGREAPAGALIVLAHYRDLDGWFEDLLSFTGERPVVFPAWDALPSADTVLDEIGGQRLRLLRQLESDHPPRILLATFQALLQPVPDRTQLQTQRRRLKVGQEVLLEGLIAWLVEHGYQRMEAIEIPGEFSRRGGILDVFSPDAEAPYRVEFVGDEIESIRQFSVETQRSLGELQAIELATQHATALAFTGHLCDYLPPGTWTVLIEPSELAEQGKYFLERIADTTGLFSIPPVFQKLVSFPSVHVSALPSSSLDTTCHLRVESVERFSGDVRKIKEELDTAAARDSVLIACHNDAEKKRLGDVLADSALAREGRLQLTVGHVRAGFRLLFSRAPEGSGDGALGKDTATENGATTPLTPTPLPPKRGERGRKGRGKRVKDGDADGTTSALPFGSRLNGADANGSNGVASLVVLGDHELFLRDQVAAPLPRRRLESKAIDSFLELQPDDLVVHLSHGIARYRGLHMLEKNGQAEEHLILEFAGGTLVYVPASRIELVQKYVGGGRVDPELSKLGGTSWQKRKERVQAAVFDLASEMVELQALRESKPGIDYPPDSDWQREFEAAFPYQETPDQLSTMAEIKRDMQRSRPMDRLICGDVGYGKTELAIRAAFKAIDNGKQVAVLVPTTVLAEQHYRTFTQRLAEYPFVVEGISRFRTHGEQRDIVKRLGDGAIDIVIGTHRVVSQDVKFKDLGLVIIDEEQRFGVEHKERLKKLRQTVDVLTLTATPIPRTLHLSLLGIRDISNLETPPQGRLAIETRIARFDPTLIRHAILRELNRDGQVYFVHNRVHNIKEIAAAVHGIVPEARIVIGHGQMAEGELEEAMVRFVKREADVLVATTIIESGLDIPNANTIFINQADNYGLADLHQLRGRVGRYKHRAYAYMLLDSERTLTPAAARRLKAIEEFNELGAGFKIAMRDLEIRGAGNILGTQQSGHIAAVGYELYCSLLENAVRSLKAMPVKTPLETTVELPWPAYLPRDYVPGQKQKIEAYRRLARIRKLDRLEDFENELRDRFGAVPEPVKWLLRLHELRLLAARWQIAGVHLEGKGIKDLAASQDDGAPLHLALAKGPVDVVFEYRNSRRIDKLAKGSVGRLRVVDERTAYYRLRAGELEAAELYACLKHLLRLPIRAL